jgi:predicted SnoaL-like aldol condensation-catalyzing enzyme
MTGVDATVREGHRGVYYWSPDLRHFRGIHVSFFSPRMAVTAGGHDLMKANTEVIQDVIEHVVNQKRIDAWDQYFSQDYIARGAPYVGLGLSVDSSENKHIIDFIVPGSPAEGKLQVGDELLWAEDEYQRWATYEDISQRVLQGSRGSGYRMGVRRGDQTLEYEVSRGSFRGLDTGNDQAKSDMQEFMTKQIPDLTATIKLILADGDMVVCLLEYHGTHASFEREAVWREAWFARLSEGKIVESWPVIDESSYLRQLGYQLIPPRT